jgi:tetratricopeptide (TPR) repeat protein
MNNLEPQDQQHLSAAQGWIELGNLAEARRELDSLSPAAAAQPDALEGWWQFHAAAREWEAALAAAARLIKLDPERCSGHIHLSFSLHELKRTQEAWDQLLPAAARFPGVSTIPYNLACYACQLGHLKEARQWLTLALSVGNQGEVLAMALRDADLQPLWPELRSKEET